MVTARFYRDGLAEEVSEVTSIENDGESRVQQQFAKDADINEIVRRFGLTGELPPPRQAAEYGDFRLVVDFQSAMEQLARSREAFFALPAEVREEFDYDPALFVDWVSDPANAAAARSRGLLPELPGEAVPGDVQADA